MGEWFGDYNLRMFKPLWDIKIVGVLAVLVIGGCRDPLFPKDAERSPYQRYSELHGRSTGGFQEQSQTMEPGRMERNLRQRLSPLDTP